MVHKMPTSQQLHENAVKTLKKHGFSEREIVRLVSANYDATRSEVNDILRGLKRPASNLSK